ncbi:MAG: metallophosphoesterase [Oscillospiraceae bacterium]|nr:metallophosphoesterase [Oscillospiraceae bacterium]
MSTYCIADIHGCYDEFMALLQQIRFDSSLDELYILGDAIDRGERSADCVRFIMQQKNTRFFIGNHEQMMFDYIDGTEPFGWFANGGGLTSAELKGLPGGESAGMLSYLRSCPYYEMLEINGKRYFLSHAGLDVMLPPESQTRDALIWSREEFYDYEGLRGYTCIFGHTPTFFIHKDYDNCDVWFDPRHNDKICIDSGCVYGGALAAIRLEDHKIFYVQNMKR